MHDIYSFPLENMDVYINGHINKTLQKFNKYIIAYFHRNYSTLFCLLLSLLLTVLLSFCFAFLSLFFILSYYVFFFMLLPADLHHLRAVKADKHASMADEHDLRSYFLSAKLGDHVQSTFYRIAADLAGIELNKTDVEGQAVNSFFFFFSLYFFYFLFLHSFNLISCILCLYLTYCQFCCVWFCFFDNVMFYGNLFHLFLTLMCDIFFFFFFF